MDTEKEPIIHPELRLSAAFIKFFLPSFKENTAQLANTVLGTMKGKCKVRLYYEQRFIQRLDGSDLRITVYAPIIRKPNAPVLVWFHGGGYGLGTPEMNEKLFKKLIDRTGCVIISPDYRLSVESPYPAAIDDCYTTLKWVKDYGAEYMININQIMVGGESAGGGLTAAITHMARDKGEVNIAFQIPLYPMIDDRMQTESATDNLKDPIWNSKSNYEGWKLYLGDLFETEKVPVYAAAARADNFKNLPPCLTYVGSVEPFLDETRIYVEKLKAEGIPVYFNIYDGGFHAFDTLISNSSIAKEAIEFLLDTFEYATQNYFKENR
ncbi:alpha/beta hydrolase [Acholeplasma equirhinis]|uniref:alpha/beta hydrolase n=1 Tax=Acholeplasma equirhinis TaxID=555393 RepID=UPI00197AC83D|nr:alpha/beta hydrolase [Acholeplasma equirhinis]MBN3490332.1 alpha/beta hydrolase [Acholeplasma equirhinis]